MRERRRRTPASRGSTGRAPARPATASSGERVRPVRIPPTSSRSSVTVEDRPVRARQRDERAAPERTIFGLSTGRALIMAAVISALALTLTVPLRTYFAQNAESARLSAEHKQLVADVAALRDKRAQQQDPAYVRAQARSRLRLVDPGDTPYIVQLPGADAAAAAATEEPAPPPGPWYSQLWRTVSSPQVPPAPAITTPPPPPSAPSQAGVTPR